MGEGFSDFDQQIWPFKTAERFLGNISGPLCLSDGVPIGLKRPPNEENADARHEYTGPGSEGAPESKPGHIPLRLEVLFGPPLIALGLLITAWGYRTGDWRDDSAAHVLVHVGAILTGGIISAYGLLFFMF